MNKQQIWGSHPGSVVLSRRCGRRHRKSSDSLFVAQVAARFARHHHRASVVVILRQGRQPLLMETSTTLRLARLRGLFKPKHRRRLPVRFVDCWLPVACRSAGRSNAWLVRDSRRRSGRRAAAPPRIVGAAPAITVLFQDAVVRGSFIADRQDRGHANTQHQQRAGIDDPTTDASNLSLGRLPRTITVSVP